MATPTHDAHAAVVWLDHWHAVVARRRDGATGVVELDRGAEPERDFVDRVAGLTDDCDRLMILGPGEDGLALSRAYVGHHASHLVALDLEASAAATPNELFDRLRLLEGEERAGPAG
jgi:hypothetical protein